MGTVTITGHVTAGPIARLLTIWSPSRIAAVYGECYAKDEAGRWAAEPEYGRGDLFRAPQSTDRLIVYGVGQVELPFLDHVGNHRGLDRSWANRIDADSARRVFECGAAGESEYAVLGCMVGGAAWESDEASQ